ncbi:MAG: transglycosylase domain-containing protein, partial [Candidatus Peribacteraceae bacterium]
MQPPGFQTRPLSEGNGLPRRNSSRPPRPGFFRFLSRKARTITRLTVRKSREIRSWKKKKIFVRAGIALGLLGFIYVGILWITLPDLRDPASLLASQSSVITDRNGVELYRLFSEEDRTYVQGENIPVVMKHAAIAIEDERFYDRGCLDLKAIARAVLFLGRAGGGSTITRQLARNALNLFDDNRYERKIKEVFLGCQLERWFTKDELIDLYLNWIPFGQNAYGIEQASQVYFGHAAADLTLAESAVLAALPQRPSYFSPYGNHVHTIVAEDVEAKVLNRQVTRLSQIADDSMQIGLLGTIVGTGSTILSVGGRTDQVLMNMQEQGFITEQERLKALSDLDTMEFQPSREDIRAPHFVLWIREEVERMFAGKMGAGMLEQGGLTIETSLDWELQQMAAEVVEDHREDIRDRFGAQNIALVALDARTREVLAYVGNVDYNDEEHGGKIDMVIAPRQPGSSFKPIVYAAAFNKGYNPATVLYDVPTTIGEDEPQNFDGTFMGPLTMRQALGASRNIPAAKTFFLAGGEKEILQLATSLGAPGPAERQQELSAQREDGFDYGWPLALGAAETPLMEMVQAYATFASGGEYADTVRILRITDKNGNILFQADVPPKTTPVLDPRIAYQITSVLSDEWARPEEYWREQLTVPGYQTAAKTGTSNKCLEWKNETTCLLRKPDNAWLIGYTPQLVTGVWAGNADSSSMYEKAGGLNTVSPVWRDFMIRAHRSMESGATTFVVPEGIVQPQVSLLSGQLPTDCTPVDLRRADIFLEENAPTLPDPACKNLTVDKLTHLLASDRCPVEAQEEGKFLVAHSLLPDRWPQWEEGVQKWVANQMELWYATETHSGAIIPLPVAPTEECDPDLTPGRLVRPELTVAFPQDGGVASYPSFRPRISYTVGSSIRTVEYAVDGKLVATVMAEPFDAALRVPRSIAKTGIHALTVTLTDEYFNKVSAQVRFRFDED